MAQFSTAVSDGVLALSAFYAAWRLRYTSFWAFTAFLLICSAAVCGSTRFSGIRSNFVHWHKFLSWVANAFGVPLLVIAYWRQQPNKIVPNVIFAAASALLLLYKVLSDNIRETATLLVSGAALIFLAFRCLFVSFNLYGLAGVVLYLFAGLYVKTEGYYSGVRRVDIFHYVLAVGNIAFLLGLV